MKLNDLSKTLAFPTFKFAILFAVIAIYFGAVDNLNWLYWVAFGLVLVERLWVQAKYLVGKFVVSKIEQELMKQLQNQFGSQNPPLFSDDNPPPK